MNRLWVRMSLAYAATVLLATAVILAGAVVVGRAESPRSVAERGVARPGGLAELLAGHYRARGSWDEAGPLLDAAQSLAPPDAPAGLELGLADADGKPVLPPDGVGRPPRQDGRASRVPILVDGTTVGFLRVMPGVTPSAQDRVRGLLLRAAAVLGLLGVGFGIAMGRNLAAPLGRLAEAARALGPGNLGARVAVTGSDEVREVASAFNDMADALERAEAQRRQMVADIAHELRTPLSVMRANLQALLDGVYPLEAAEVARLAEHAEHLDRLVGDLHELALAEAGELRLERAPVDVADVARVAGASFAALAGDAGVEIVTDLPDHLPAVSADARRLTQVLGNLVANAVRHTPSGGTVALRAGAGADHVWLAVQDSGAGIDPADLPHVFERFYRADPSRSRASGGAGLGLAIARAIVVAHGGTLTAESEGQGRGSTFTVRLPTADHQPGEPAPG